MNSRFKPGRERADTQPTRGRTTSGKRVNEESKMRGTGGVVLGIARKARALIFSFVPAALAASLLLCGVGAADADAVPTWLSPATLSASNVSAEDGHVAVNAAGETVAVWQIETGGHEVIQASVKPASGSWEAPVTLSETSRNSYHPRIALDAAGEAIAVWQLYDGSHWVAQVSTKPSSGSWQAPIDISQAGVDATSTTIAFGPDSEAIVAWAAGGSGSMFVQATSRPEAGGSWQTPVAISQTGPSAYEPKLAVNSHGQALAVWSMNLGSFYGAQVAARTGAGSWQTPTTLSPAGHYAEQAHVAINDAGEAIASWTVESGSKELAQSATSADAGASWSSPLTQAEGEGYFGPATQQNVDIDASGDAIVVWSIGHGSANAEAVGASVRPGGGSWQTPVTLSGSSSSSTDSSRGADVGFNANGEALAVWTHRGSSSSVAEASLLASPTGAWSAPQAISAAGEYAYGADIAVEERGNAVALWDMYSGSRPHVQSATFVSAGPELSEVSIPAAGEVGEWLSFSVNPLDPWASLGATEWSFGDGEAEEGTSVTHAYTSAGSYEVQVTSADVLGNVSSQTATVNVQAPEEETPEEEGSEEEGPQPHEEAPAPHEEAPAPSQPSPQTGSPIQAVTLITPPPADTVATTPLGPPLALLNKAPQPLINTNQLILKVVCSESPCVTRAWGWVRLPGHNRRTWRLAGSQAAVAGDATSRVTLSVPRKLRNAVRGYLVHHPHYQVQLHLIVALGAGEEPSQTVESTLPIRTFPGFR
jgi:hypothetical protein